ncbi:MAG TPA: 3-oxoacyl-ACP synthase, partial [Ruminococcaceae bacterium]|nr:3-oxoacyl-ACP synthase [Oscillospiraceae bacterium]
ICATLTPHYCAPPNAAEIRKRLGIENAVAFDMNAQCTGFIFSCAVAHSMMKTLGFKNALVIGSEILSKLTDWTDRTTCILYGDGAGAAILSDSEDSSGIKSVYLEGSNDFDDSLVCLSALNDSPFAVPQQANTKIQMKGGKVFTYAVGAMKRSVNKVLESSGFSLDDIKWIIPHQANLRIITSTANRLNVEMDRFFVNIDHTGNTSSATIPIALHELYNTGQLQKGDLIILTGFGAGLAAGALLLEW